MHGAVRRLSLLSTVGRPGRCRRAMGPLAVFSGMIGRSHPSVLFLDARCSYGASSVLLRTVHHRMKPLGITAEGAQRFPARNVHVAGAVVAWRKRRLAPLCFLERPSSN